MPSFSTRATSPPATPEQSGQVTVSKGYRPGGDVVTTRVPHAVTSDAHYRAKRT